MKKTAAIIGIVISALILSAHGGFCSKDTIPDNGKKGYPSYYTRDLVVDGNPAEWPSKLFYENNEAKVLYAVANDSSSLFFCLEVLDRQTQMTILHEGIILWADPAGKKKETCSIRILPRPLYPVEKSTAPHGGPASGPPPGGTSVPGSPPKDNQRMNPKQKLQQFTGEIKVAGFREPFNGAIPFEEKGKGFLAAVAYDAGGALVVEGCIPLQAFATNPNLSKCLSLGFTIEQKGGGPGGRGQQGDMHGNGPPGVVQDGNDMGGGMPGGQGGSQGMGGSRGNGGGPHDRNGQQDQSKSFKIWHKFSVAKMP